MSKRFLSWFAALAFPVRVCAFAALVAPGLALIVAMAFIDGPTGIAAGFGGLLYLFALNAFLLPADAFRGR